MLDKLYVFADARQQSLFNDTSGRVRTISSLIEKEIAALSSRIDTLASNYELDTSNMHMEQHAKSIVDTLRLRLTDIIKGFQDALELRSRVMQQQEALKNKFSFSSSSGLAVAETMSSAPQPSAHPDDPEAGRVYSENAAMLQGTCK